MKFRIENKNHGLYNVNFYFNNILISDETGKDSNGFIFVESTNENFNPSLFLDSKCYELPDKIDFRLEDDNDFFELFQIEKNLNKICFVFCITIQKMSALPLKEKIFISHFKEQISKHQFINFSVEDEEDFYNTNFVIRYQSSDIELTLKELLYSSRVFLNNILRAIERDINGINWKEEYLFMESSFTLNLVIPLIKKLGFKQVKYNHGINEFGKDVIFSKIDEFGEKKFSAIQVKIGNISGNVRGKVDEIIQQIDDAFKIPFQFTGTEDLYISSLIIIVSGEFTNNAKIKIKHKIDKHLLGSITFLGKEDILNLLNS